MKITVREKRRFWRGHHPAACVFLRLCVCFACAGGGGGGGGGAGLAPGMASFLQ